MNTNPSSASGYDVPALHLPIMVDEVLQNLKVTKTEIIVDATLGLGGHTAQILRTNPNAIVIGFDRDGGALTLARQRLAEYGPRLQIIHGNFADLAELLPQEFRPVDGVLMDLGISSWQLAERGFSFRTDAPLDFRMNPEIGENAADLVNTLPESELADLLYTFGEERASRRIAAAIVAARPVETTTQLADVIERAVGRRGRLHPATKSFQALRIAVNDELGSLERGLVSATAVLRPGGRLVVISFHSLEDRIVKRFMKENVQLSVVNKKVIRPSREEILANSRSRSAKLRIAEKVTET